MKNYNQAEVILSSKYSFKDDRQKELLKWMSTTVQFVVERQQVIAKKLFLANLKDTPAIYMS
jgi:hypothetical protein